jgi:hypothetical protein
MPAPLPLNKPAHNDNEPGIRNPTFIAKKIDRNRIKASTGISFTGISFAPMSKAGGGCNRSIHRCDEPNGDFKRSLEGLKLRPV